MSGGKIQLSAAFESRMLLLYVASLAAIMVIFYCWTLLMYSNTHLPPQSVLMFTLANQTSGISARNISNSSPPSSIRQGGVHQISQQNKGTICGLNQASLKVYMYDLPPEFHFGMLDWKGEGNQIWPDVCDANQVPRYPGGLNLQHSMEYWLTLDLLASNTPGAISPCMAIRVMNSSSADVVFVPFFSSLSYNRQKVSRNKLLQDELVKYLMSQGPWRRGGGKDHLIPVHHPNSMLEVRRKLGSAMFLLADFGRYSSKVANLGKDIVAPYRHVVNSAGNDSTSFENRHTLAYFQGAIFRKDGGRIRQKLYQLLQHEKDVHFAYGTAQRSGVKNASIGMAFSKFCLNIAGDTPSSNRLFDAIVSHCVPVIISDDIELPFEDVLDYSEFCVFVRASDAVKKDFLLNLLRGITRKEWTRMWQRLKQVAHHFEYQYPSQEGDAVQMIWEAVSRKILGSLAARLEIHRANRFRQSRLKAR